MKTPHSSYPKGTTLFIICRNGDQIVDKFLDHKSGKIILENYGPLSMKQVRSCSQRRLSVSTSQERPT